MSFETGMLPPLQRGNIRLNPVLDVRPPEPTGITPDELARANAIFDSRYDLRGNHLNDRHPVNWIPVPPGYDRLMENWELDTFVIPWNGSYQSWENDLLRVRGEMVVHERKTSV